MVRCSCVRRLGLALVAAVTLAVFAAPASAAPRNDKFQNAQPIRIGAAVRGTINGATKQPGEPRHARSLAGRSVWYRFRATRRLTVSLNTCGASFDSVLAAYTGRALRSLKLVNYNNNGCGVGGGTGSRIAFTAGRGQTYWIAVAGFAPRGNFRLRAARLAVPPNDNFADAVSIGLGETIDGTTRDATRELGEPSHGDAGVHTVWFRFSVTAARVVRLDACRGDDPPRIAVYRGGRVNRLARVAAIDECFVQFAAQPGVIYRVVLVETGRGLSFRLRARVATPPGNDNFVNATEVTIGSTTPATTRDATREPGEPGGVNQYPFTVWFRLTLPAGATVEITACPTGESQITVFNGTRLEGLTSFGVSSCKIRVTTTQTVLIYIHVQSLREADFNLIAESVTTPP